MTDNFRYHLTYPHICDCDKGSRLESKKSFNEVKTFLVGGGGKGREDEILYKILIQYAL